MRRTILDKIKNQILPLMPNIIINMIGKLTDETLSQICEVRMRVGKEISLKMDSFEKPLSQLINDKYLISQEDINRTIGLMCRNSLYAVNEEIRNGFITINGGHRVGIVGRMVIENEMVKNIKNFSGINIRISREFIGCSNELIKYIYENRNYLNTLIVSPPCCGKTTIMRDLVRQISNGIPQKNIYGKTVSLIDERSELAACCNGEPQNDIGMRTDVLDCCPKSEGIMIMIRAMGPEIIAVDEIGSRKDADAIMNASSCGVSILATMHGNNVEDVLRRVDLQRLFEQKVFKRIIVLSGRNGPGTIEEIINWEKQKNIYYQELNTEVV